MRFLAFIPILAFSSCSSIESVTDAVGDRFGGPNVQVVQVRPDALKELQTGKDLSVAYQPKKRYTASSTFQPSSKWDNFTLPEDFELPELPQIEDGNATSETSPLLLPPRS